jgi:hypothetical protein
MSSMWKKWYLVRERVRVRARARARTRARGDYHSPNQGYESGTS